MKNDIRNTLMVSLGALIAVLLVVFVLMKPKASGEPEVPEASKKSFDDRYLIPVDEDSLVAFLQRKYPNQIIITKQSPLIFTIQNQGSKVSNFYNDNERMLTIKGEGFDINKGKDNSISASFEVKNIDQKNYVLLPTDVLYGIFAE